RLGRDAAWRRGSLAVAAEEEAGGLGHVLVIRDAGGGREGGPQRSRRRRQIGEGIERGEAQLRRLTGVQRRRENVPGALVGSAPQRGLGGGDAHREIRVVQQRRRIRRGGIPDRTDDAPVTDDGEWVVPGRGEQGVVGRTELAGVHERDDPLDRVA